MNILEDNIQSCKFENPSENIWDKCGYAISEGVNTSSKLIIKKIRADAGMTGTAERYRHTSKQYLFEENWLYTEVKGAFIQNMLDIYDFIKPNYGRQVLFFKNCLINAFEYNNEITWENFVGPTNAILRSHRNEKAILSLISDFDGLELTYSGYVSDTLRELYEDSKDENPLGIGVSEESLRNFYLFLNLYPNVHRPSVSLFADYDIYISWRNSENGIFSIRFISENEVRFVKIKPDKNHSSSQLKFTGIVRTEALRDLDEIQDVWEWIYSE